METTRKGYYGWLFAMPWLLGIAIFYLYPLLSSFYYSFTKFNGFDVTGFVGFANYVELVKDELFWISVRNTFYYALLAVPTGLILGVFLAIMLNVKTRLQGIYRVIYFIPTLVPIVACGVIWQWLLNAQFGVVNYLLYEVGLPQPGWFSSEIWSMPSLVLIAQWCVGSGIIVFLAGLQDIPGDYYEAATIDGGGHVRKFWHITLPLMSPVILYHVIMALIGALQQFILPFIVTGGTGSPANSLLFYNMLLYKKAFAFFEMGHANAMAWLMFVAVMVLTVVLNWSSKRWVHYMGD
ncbi:spermidine/putrescine ABC transporter permease [Cohnella sp. CIP 111063]|uniref:carbohydrate ABC transporter permease n=1 Tax=unclassified Cohnella TaxID=2636738 RepID=UPI000B8C4FC0|nr:MULTISPECIES: sugar ABC transporter permease [unclassified Cohnella]OXS53879.1 spermidine/putrescine ABC transporter permease [Cohnella sp. CIP 111063]PRX62464.1 carbohydrate ABC transporter membrane protein 1 (CUT1 family) [Cohnella sp. SGD-V74]